MGEDLLTEEGLGASKMGEIYAERDRRVTFVPIRPGGRAIDSPLPEEGSLQAVTEASQPSSETPDPPAAPDAAPGSAPGSARGSAGGPRATLSRELSEFLVELSIGAHRFAMYPPGHPSQVPVVENVIGRLAELFEARNSLSIGVARQQLVVEGVATDPRHPVLADLARRLHDHQLAAVSFARGTHAREVQGLLETLSGDTGREVEPIGLLPPDEIPGWEHVRIHPVGYDRLTLREEAGEGGGGDRATQLWLGLAQAAMATEEPMDAESSGDVGEIARAISDHGREDAYDQVIVGYLLQLTEELKDRGAEETAKIRQRMSDLINELDERTLTRLVEMGGDVAQRKQFVLDANHSLAVDAVVKVVEAAASTRGQTISNSFTRMLSKLALHAEQGQGRLRNQADTALRENVEELIDGWELEDPNPDQYTAVLDSMARSTPLFDRSVSRNDGEHTGPERIIEMALEVDAWGATVAKAVHDLLEGGMAGRLLHLVEEATAESRVAERIRQDLTSPARFRQLFAGDDVDEEELRRLVGRMGEAAVDPLLEVLAESDSRSVRRKVFDVLPRMGPVVGERALARLSDTRWFVLRNMLALLGRLPRLPEGFDPIRFTRHEDHRVRREAFTLAIRDPASRSRSLATALGETDERLVRMALLELQEGIPETLVPTVVNRVVQGERGPEIRALGARALDHSRSRLSRDALVRVVVEGTSLFGRVRLADASPPVLAALAVLARRWTDDGEVGPVLAAARKSKDPEIRSAVEEGMEEGA